MCCFSFLRNNYIIMGRGEKVQMMLKNKNQKITQTDMGKMNKTHLRESR